MAGCGKMGGAMLSRWIGGADAFTAVEPGDGPVPDGAHRVRSVDEVGDARFDALIVAVKPQRIEDVLPAYVPLLADGAYALSMAAGVSAARVSRAIGGVPVVRIMPNLPAAVGRGVTGLFAGLGVTEAQKDHAQRLVEATGEAFWVEEEDRIDRVTALAGSGPGYVFEILRAYTAAAEALGFAPDEARRLVLATVAGTTEMALRDPRPLDELRNAVTSPNGTTQAGLDALRRDDLPERLLTDALRAAYDRAVELR